MKKIWFVFFGIIILSILNANFSFGQCSICTKTAEQLGEGPAKALNTGIIYLMATPLAIIGFIGYKWWKNEKELNKP
jgi:hypothetical protein